MYRTEAYERDLGVSVLSGARCSGFHPGAGAGDLVVSSSGAEGAVNGECMYCSKKGSDAELKQHELWCGGKGIERRPSPERCHRRGVPRWIRESSAAQNVSLAGD